MKPTQYTYIQETLEGRIRDCVYAEGAKLPTEEALATEFGVNRHTVRRALKNLVDYNYIVRRPRVGSIVVSRESIRSHSEKIKIKYLFFSDNTERDLKRSNVFRQICDDFSAKNPGIEVELSPIARQGMLLSPHLPAYDDTDAVMVARVDYIADYAWHGLFMPLDQFDDITQVTSELDGRLIRHIKGVDDAQHIYALPERMTAWMMAVNISLFKELGFSEKDIPKTWREFINISRKISELGNDAGILPFEPLLYHPAPQSITRYLPYLYNISSEGLFIESGGKLQINRQPTEHFLEWLSEMYSFIPEQEVNSTQYFYNNKAVFRMSVAVGFIDEFYNNGDSDIQAYPIPLFDAGGVPSTVLNAAFSGILARSANTDDKKQAAWKFIKYMSGTEAQKKAYELLGDLPTRTDVFPYVFSSSNKKSAFLDFALKYGKRAYDYPYNTDIHGIILQAMSNVVKGISAPSTAVDEAQFMLNHYAFKKNSVGMEHCVVEAL